MHRRETEQILEAVHAARASGERAALATVVRVRGSAYRREGARMLVRQDGSYHCLLSGGCLEPAVVDIARNVMATGEAVVVSYDLSEEVVWGLGIGCGGSVDIRLERLGDDPVMDAWLDALGRAAPAVLVTPLAGCTGRLLVTGAGEAVGALDDPLLEREAVVRARQRLAALEPGCGAEWLGRTELFFEVSGPAPELVVFGAGHDAMPLVRLARQLGWAVTVVDRREAFLTPERFPGARLVLVTGAADAPVQPGQATFVLVMNHNLERDEEHLRLAFESAAPYIGVLGPRSRYQKLIAGLAAQGYAPPAARLAAVRSPVGLALGAETPEEVAVSVVGEMMAVRRGFRGGFLGGLDGPIHRASEASLTAFS